MTPINVKRVHQASFLHIERKTDPLGSSLSTHGQRSQRQSGQLFFGNRSITTLIPYDLSHDNIVSAPTTHQVIYW